MKAKPSFQVKLLVTTFKEGDTYIAYTPMLDLSTSGKSFFQAKKRFTEAVEIFFEELIAKGTLDEVLASLGWKKTSKEWQPPLSIDHSLEQFSIPLSN